MITERMVAVLSMVLLVAGCAQEQRPAVTASNTDCRSSYGLRQATLLGARAMDVTSPGDLALLSRLSDAKAQAKADELNAKLDDLDREAQGAKTEAGECFGDGDYGNEVAEKYAWVEGMITEQRNAVNAAVEIALVC